MKIVHDGPQLLVLEWGNLGKQLFGAALIAAGCLMLPSLKDHVGGGPPHKGGWFAVVALVATGVRLLFASKKRCTFDRRIGRFTVESRKLVGQSQFEVPLSEITAIGVKKAKNDSGTALSKWSYQVELCLSADGVEVPWALPGQSSAVAANELTKKICTLLKLQPPSPASLPPASFSEMELPTPVVVLLVLLVLAAFGFLVWKGMQ